MSFVSFRYRLGAIHPNSERVAARQRGNVAITFAFAAVPVIMAVGAAVDYSLANRTKAVLDSVADAAVLSATNQAAMSLTAKNAETRAVKFFNAEAASLKRGSVTTVSAKVTDNGNGRTAVVTYTAAVPTSLMGIAGINNINIGGSSTAASAVPTYIDFYLLLDNTPSMGVGATPADITTMVNNTPDQCAFACHQLDVAPNDYYGLAKKLGVTTRIDVVRSATQQLMDTAAATQTVSGQFRAAIYTFGAAASTAGLTKIQSLTSSLSGAKTAAGNIDLMTVPYQNYASDTDTNFDDVLAGYERANCHARRRLHLIEAAEDSVLRFRRRCRCRQYFMYAIDERGPGPADRHQIHALPGAAHGIAVQDDERPRHHNRRAVHHLFGLADQLLVHELDRSVQ